jgi:hypothetical protein
VLLHHPDHHPRFFSRFELIVDKMYLCSRINYRYSIILVELDEFPEILIQVPVGVPPKTTVAAVGPVEPVNVNPP